MFWVELTFQFVGLQWRWYIRVLILLVGGDDDNGLAGPMAGPAKPGPKLWFG
jgi:hypothetical protein